MSARSVALRKHVTQTASKTSIKMIVQLICILACSVHLLILSVDYFKFKTIALYAPYIPFEQTLPYFSLCLKLDAETVKKLPHGSQTSRPIEQSAVIRDCHLRNFTSKELEQVDCQLGYVTTQTTRRRLYDCYSIAPKVFTKYMILEAAAVLKNRRVLYTFYLSHVLFDTHDELIPLIHFKRRANEEFRYFQSVLLGNGRKNTSIEIGYETLDILLLPPPYDTDCINASLCLDSQGIRHKWCTKEICNNTVAMTYRRAQEAPIDGIFVEVRSLASPSTRLSYAPNKILSSFILEIFSLLGLWISFSIHLLFQSTGKLFSFLIKRSSPIDTSAKIHPKISKDSGVELFKVSSVAKARSPIPSSPPKASRGTRILKFLLKSIVLIFFLREFYIISTDYCTFKTHMDIQIRPNAMVEYPSISYCIDIYEWFNHDEPSRFYKSFDKLMSDFSEGFNFTLKQMFELTPTAESAINKCQVRSHSPKSPLETTSDCSRHFNVTKFFYGEFMCYNFQPKVDFIPPNEFDHDLSIIYSVILDQRLAKSYHYQAIVSYALPKDSRLLVTEGWKQHKLQLTDLSFKLYKYTRLPAPYDSGCSVSIRPNECELECMNFTQIGLVPFSNLHTEPIDLPVLDYMDLKNATIANFMQQAEDRCSRACLKPCDSSFASTMRKVSASNHSQKLTLQSPKFPVYFFNAYPVHTIYEFIYQLGCSASFWIGFSLLGVLLISSKFKRDLSSVTSSSTHLSRKMKQFERSFSINQQHPRKGGASTSRLGRWRNNLKSRLKTLFISTILTIGFCVQTFSTASVYLSYPVSMDTRMVANDNYTELKSTVCISIDQLNLNGDYSLQNIWTQSPAPYEVIIECGYRGVHLPQLAHLPKNLRQRVLPYINSTSQCNLLFKVKKFSTLGLICYEVAPGESTTDTEYRTQYQILDSRVYGYFILSPRVSSYNLTIALSQGPSVNTLLMPTTPHRTWPSSFCVYYFLHYTQYRLTSLPHPYDMDVYESLKRIMCMRNCIGRKMRASNVFSPYGTAVDPSYLPYETEINSIQNNSLQIRKQCESLCKYQINFKKMRDIYFDTFSEGPYGWFKLKRHNGTISLWLTTSVHLTTETAFYPQLRFVDLVISIGSLFAVWFGLSVLQLIDLISNKILDDVEY